MILQYQERISKFQELIKVERIKAFDEMQNKLNELSKELRNEYELKVTEQKLKNINTQNVADEKDNITSRCQIAENQSLKMQTMMKELEIKVIFLNKTSMKS